MSTPWKTVEDGFWTWIQGAVTLPAGLHIFRSHEGRELAFADSFEKFRDPAHMPAMWLRLVGIDAENEGENTILDHLRFEGGIAMNVAPDATSRDVFEAVVADVRAAILGDLLSASPGGVFSRELTNERVRLIAPSFGGAAQGYVWHFALRLSGASHVAP